MFEPRPLALAGGIGVIDMELLSVSRRWYYRDHFSIREISDIDALGCRGTWSASTCVRTASNRSLPSQIGRAGWTHTRQAVAYAAAGGGEVAKAEADRRAIAR
jgi:hypothetical protein